MKTLLTGASGFLGGAIMRRLQGEHEVTGLCHQAEGTGLQPCDLRDRDAFAEALRTHAPQVVVHSAAYREPDFCEEHPEENTRLNVEPVRTLCEALSPDVHLIAISTDYVFDGTNPPYDEDDERHALSEYGRSKIAAEDIVRPRAQSLVVRIPVLVGAGPTLATSGYIGQLVATARDKRPVEQDHTFIRHPTWIEDVADAIAFLIRQRAQGVIHYSGARGATRYESALEVAEILGEGADHISPSATPVVRKAGRPRNAHLATGKIESLGYTRFTDFADVVREVVGSFG